MAKRKAPADVERLIFGSVTECQKADTVSVKDVEEVTGEVPLVVPLTVTV